MFVWGFVFFGAGIIDIHDHLSIEAEQSLGQALQRDLPHDGFYIVPDPASKADFAKRMAAGPFARIQFHKGGVRFGDPTVMLKGFLHMLLTCLLFGLALRLTVLPGSSYLRRLQMALLFGLAAAVFAQLGGPIWWHETWSPALKMALYDFVAFGLAGAVLARHSY